MNLADLITALSQPAAYPTPVSQVVVHQTHISAVFLAGAFAYKIKKPVALGFLDFSTLEKRRFYCEEEVRLNRRLAPSVYLGVVAVTQSGAGIRIEGDGTGDVVEWAVKMTRLPEQAALEQRLKQGSVTPAFLEALAQRLSCFHAAAQAGPDIATFGSFPVVAGNARDNFEQSQRLVGVTVSAAVHAQLRTLTEESLLRLRPLIDLRAGSGRTRDTHGDLRLDHVYWFPERPPPEDIVVMDCIEFSERFRFADPVADMAFLVMDFLFRGADDCSRVFADAYFQASGDFEGRALLPFYTAYRAIVRGKVEGIAATEKEIPAEERSRAVTRARAHWLLALGQLQPPSQRPCLILVGGLPGTGKSTLARTLAERAGFALIRTDVVRKELVGVASQAPVALGQEFYTPEWTERTYSECLRRSMALLFEGQRVLVDANFREERWRRAFLELAVSWGVPGALLLCQADPAIVRQRLAVRTGDASDADWAIHQRLAQVWEPPQPATCRRLTEIPSGGSPDRTRTVALDALYRLGLFS